ncbi:20S proteasome subunit alpha 4 [Enteropsectra breve]|nr:20S proteasome subunit alpha 4 [Enteropsectra breve]
MEFEQDHGVFSPDGRLIQVEYAQKASEQGGIAIIEATGDSINIVYESRQANPLHIPTPKIHPVDPERGIYILFSGLKPDTLPIEKIALNLICNIKYSTSVDVELEDLARKIGEFKQQYTVDESFRPLGLRTVLFGFSDGVPQIYLIETDGNYTNYFKLAIGYRANLAMEYMASDDNATIYQAILKVVQRDTKKIKSYTLDSSFELKEMEPLALERLL